MATMPREQWELESEELADLDDRWDLLRGDRMTGLVFIGIDMDHDEITAALNTCLLTSAEIKLGFDGWSGLRDPCPVWGTKITIPRHRRRSRFCRNSGSPRPHASDSTVTPPASSPPSWTGQATELHPHEQDGQRI
jgi:hypothetical protein